MDENEGLTEANLSQSTVERCLAELRKQRRVEYVGVKEKQGI